jgi:hypothetical protein
VSTRKFGTRLIRICAQANASRPVSTKVQFALQSLVSSGTIPVAVFTTV